MFDDAYRIVNGPHDPTTGRKEPAKALQKKCKKLLSDCVTALEARRLKAAEKVGEMALPWADKSEDNAIRSVIQMYKATVEETAEANALPPISLSSLDEETIQKLIRGEEVA